MGFLIEVFNVVRENGRELTVCDTEFCFGELMVLVSATQLVVIGESGTLVPSSGNTTCYAKKLYFRDFLIMMKSFWNEIHV